MHFPLSHEGEGMDFLSEAKSEFEHIKVPVTLEELEALCVGDEILEELLEDVLDQCLKYTKTIIDFNKIIAESDGDREGAETLARIDAVRKGTHDSTIDIINAFSRMLGKKSKDNSWMEKIIDNRSAYMRFAIALTLARIPSVDKTN